MLLCFEKLNFSVQNQNGIENFCRMYFESIRLKCTYFENLWSSMKIFLAILKEFLLSHSVLFFQEKAPRNSKLLLKAVEDADKSIYKKRSEIRSKAADLDEIHRNRMKATLAAKKFQRTGGDEEILPSTSSSKEKIETQKEKPTRRSSSSSKSTKRILKRKKISTPEPSSSSTSSSRYVKVILRDGTIINEPI